MIFLIMLLQKIDLNKEFKKYVKISQLNLKIFFHLLTGLLMIFGLKKSKQLLKIIFQKKN